jgi:hypothetical protein
MLPSYHRRACGDCSSLREGSGQAGQKSLLGFLFNNNGHHHRFFRKDSF